MSTACSGELIMGLTRHTRVIIVVMIYCGGFVLARKEVCGKFWFVKVYLLSNSHDSPLIYYNCYIVLCSTITVMAVKIFLFQANSNLIGHLQLESCKMGKLPVQRKERKIKHTQIALLLHVLH